LNLSEVKDAKEYINKKTDGYVTFNIPLTSSIKNTLYENFDIYLDNIPMRWIKGDTLPHVDLSTNSFENTYIVYLTDSDGSLLIEDNSYPILQNTGYVFSEGLKHKTTNTGNKPRLLLGPMNESGFLVGAATTITANGATDTIYFKYISGSGIYYKINNGSYNGLSLPITIVNTNVSSVLKALFETDIIISSDIFYFICESNNIQFGSISLKNNGTRPIITIDGVTNYPGLIQNGDNSVNGFDNIYVYNLEITSLNSSTLISNGGWFGQEYFARGAPNSYIVNCHSDGPIIDAGGGIVGGYSASNSGNLKILGCSSSGNSADYSGGIVGYYAGQDNGIIICTGCWSTGSIGANGGGIFGYGAGDTLGEVVAINCYSTGLINTNGGGIFGQISINGSAINCYSQGNILSDAGGIFGEGAASTGGITTSVNCYSVGNITTSGNGISTVDFITIEI